MQWLHTMLIKQKEDGTIIERLQEKAEEFEDTKETAMEVVDTVINFPYLGVLSYGVFMFLIFVFAIITIFLLILWLKKE
jgi:Fe2+ transport system protein B